MPKTVKEIFQVKGSGVSAQTEAALRREEVHPSQLDVPPLPEKKTDTSGQSKGKTNVEVFEEVLGEDARKRREEKQKRDLEEIKRRRGGTL